jgi:hypothetical protein
MGGGSLDFPLNATFETNGPVILNHVHPIYASPTTLYRRYRFCIALLAILIAGGAFIAWKYHQVTDIDESRPKIQKPSTNVSELYFSDGNSSEISVVNDASQSPAQNTSRASIRRSCSYSSCSSCTYWEGCGWCVPSQRCSSGEQYYTYDEMCFGGRARIDWVWYSSDCESRCSTGSYSSTGYVCCPAHTTR